MQLSRATFLMACNLIDFRYSTLKNLAETCSKQGSDHHSEALEYFLQAAAIDGKDVVLWNRLGTLACTLGDLNVARRAFEEGLLCSPRHCEILHSSYFNLFDYQVFVTSLIGFTKNTKFGWLLVTFIENESVSSHLYKPHSSESL